MFDIKKAIAARFVCKAHDRTSRTVQQASEYAGVTLDKIGKDMESNRQFEKTFFDARRRIGQAAYNVAKKHSLELSVVNQNYEDEKINFMSGNNQNTMEFINEYQLKRLATKEYNKNKDKKLANITKGWSFGNDFKKDTLFASFNQSNVFPQISTA